ncbi:uncharacterized protein C8A04DRAFT_29866 [Dichotomopilus funicola]|uniref:Uncharacterized protein n=1 Tax=Dichotomopilus funicola TaxID=1934379 RepID=A0AAN6V0L1_9PEZI|nr:hypothetical protein C8A04DRAFT_29866 [Dichotomopilus funicola]
MSPLQDVQSASLFLRLPQVIRHTIYCFMGVASIGNTPYIFDLHDFGRQFLFDNNDPSHLGDFHGLLVSCRQIHIEVAALLFSANFFVLHFGDTQYFAPLSFFIRRPAINGCEIGGIVIAAWISV